MRKIAKFTGRLLIALIFVLFSKFAVFGAKPPVQVESSEVNLDAGWRLWPDKDAAWQTDALYLPDEVNLGQMPENAPTGGWAILNAQQGIPVNLPATVEEYYWGKFGLRHFSGPWEDTSGAVLNGNYTGVSWWWRKLDIRSVPDGRRVIVSFRGARLRAEVYCNGRLCAYTIITEMPFAADITDALKPGADNLLAVRITNPGGSMNWVDRETFKWGRYNIPYSHGCGGLDGGITLQMRAAVEVADLAVINRADPHSIRLITEVSSAGPAYKGPVNLAITREGRPIWSGTARVDIAAGRSATVATDVTVNQAELWDLQHPVLYKASAKLPGRADTGRERDFGFRSFTVEGIGSDAMLKLNGNRIVLRSAISCGWWGGSGLWPTEELAEREVSAARSLGLNCLQFHRNVGRAIVLDAQDRMGLLRCEEPGAGAELFSKYTTPARAFIGGTDGEAGAANYGSQSFAERYERAKILQMVKRDRSHPSLIAFCLQNEFDDENSPACDEIINRLRKLDPSRVIVLKSGSRAAKQVMALPWENDLRYDDGTGFSGWADVHTTGGPGVYVDDLYKSPEEFSHRSNNRREIVVWGQMMGFAVPGDYAAIAGAYTKTGEAGFDRVDSGEISDAYQKFIDRYGFRADYPTPSAIFQAIGARSYFAWQKMIENCRISDSVDFMVLNGWEETIADNHSGIVDLHRGFKADPAILRRATLPEMLVIKSPHLVLATGERADADIFVVNETNRKGPYTLAFRARGADGGIIFEASDDVDLAGGEVFGQLLHKGYQFTVSTPGRVVIEATLTPKDPADGAGPLNRTEELLAVQLSGVAPQRAVAVAENQATPMRKALEEAFGIHATPLAEATNPDVILAAASETGSFPIECLDRVRNGARLILIADDGKSLVATARQLATAAVFKFEGSVGSGDIPWMGSWYFTRKHWLFDGLPSGEVMNWQYQVRNMGCEGLLLDAPGIEVAAGYGRDHQKIIGMGACVIPCGKGEIVVFAFPGMVRGLCGESLGIHSVAARKMILNAITH